MNREPADPVGEVDRPEPGVSADSLPDGSQPADRDPGDGGRGDRASDDHLPGDREQRESGDREPDGPTELTGPTWRFVLRRTVREFLRDECPDQAAGLTYYAIFALFPAMIALLSLVGLVGQAQATADALIGIAEDLGVPSSEETLRPFLESLGRSTARPGLALVFGLAVALWSASAYVGSFGRVMNRIYEVREGRPFWKLRPLMLLVTLLAIVLAAAVALALVLTGPVAAAVGDALGIGPVALTAWNIAKWPVLVLVVALIVALLYYATPNVRQPKFRWISPGAVVAIVIWAIASFVFGIYVSSFASYDRTYGTLAGVIVFLLWLWITNLALLFGAELDSELERGRELQEGLPAEEELQLPPRDTTKIEKEQAQQRAEIAAARAIRHSAGSSESAAGEPRPDPRGRQPDGEPERRQSGE